MTLTKKVKRYMAEIDKKGCIIPSISNSKLVNMYYLHIGLRPEESFKTWMEKVATGEMPTYTSVLNSVKHTRRENPVWAKERIDSKMMLKSVDLGGGHYEIGGVRFTAKSHAAALRKYARTKHNENS